MAYVYCPKCDKGCSPGTDNCPQCGHPLTEQGRFIQEQTHRVASRERSVSPPPKSAFLFPASIVIAALAVVTVIVWGILKDGSEDQEYENPVFSRHQEAGANNNDYEIVGQNDLSYRGTVRLELRIKVNEPVTETRLRVICEKVIDWQRKSRPLNSIVFFFYLPDSDVTRHYTAGRAVWAPNGELADAGTVAAGDYSKNELVVEVGNALLENMPSLAYEDNLPKSKRMEIFYNSVALEDQGITDMQQIYRIIAEKYGIDVDTAESIAVEGGMNGWPMPPPPSPW